MKAFVRAEEDPMAPYKRIDRFIESAIYRFAGWIGDTQWIGKERDCVNIFATRFVLPTVCVDSAISEYSQVRIECGVPQPAEFDRPSAAKDLVVWRGPLDVAWDSDWKPSCIPWVVIEWKTRRKGRFNSMFDDHDVDWLKAFTAQNPESFGYAVTVDFRQSARQVHCAKFKKGEMKVRRRLIRPA